MVTENNILGKNNCSVITNVNRMFHFVVIVFLFSTTDINRMFHFVVTVFLFSTTNNHECIALCCL